MSFVTGVGLTSYGKHEGLSSLDLMSKAAELAIADAGLKRAEIDGILCGYSTVSPHIMLATVFAEHFGIRPSYAHAVQVGGATGLAMTMLAHQLVDAGVAKHVLVVGGENRLTGQSRDASIQASAASRPSASQSSRGQRRRAPSSARRASRRWPWPQNCS